IRTARSIRATQYQRANQLFLRPAIVHEAGGEMVEQFRMGRNFSSGTEVVDAADDPLAEQLLPDAVDDNASSQWITSVGQPVSELQATTLTCRNCREGFP